MVCLSFLLIVLIALAGTGFLLADLISRQFGPEADPLILGRQFLGDVQSLVRRATDPWARNSYGPPSSWKVPDNVMTTRLGVALEGATRAFRRL
jgi:hypothetical protein